jgi:multidrug resistance efflux pump
MAARPRAGAELLAGNRLENRHDNETHPKVVAAPDRAFDARARSALLREAFDRPSRKAMDDAPAADDEPGVEARTAGRRWAWRLVKAAAGLAIIIIFGWTPAQRFLALSTSEAVVNARLVTLRAPIDGEVAAIAVAPEVGTRAEQGSSIIRISNPRADRSRLDDFRRTIAQLEGERPAVVARVAKLGELHTHIVGQASLFQSGRIRELEMRVLETGSVITGAAASRAEAEATAQRVTALAANGTVSKAALDKAQRDRTVAIEGENSLRHRLAAVEVELEAARNGSFVSDSYNDRPSSTQQADELSIRIAELDADLRTRDDRLQRLQQELQREAARYAEMAGANLVSPVNGSIWEVLVSPGEEVRRGQDLVRLLDCSGVVVTAAVSESVYNRLRVNDAASFRFSGDAVDYTGRVMRLSGLAAPLGNLAIQPSALLNGAYRVTVAIPEFTGQSCGVGRTGRVTFQPQARPLTERIAAALSGS